MTAPFYGEPLPQRGTFDWRRNLQPLPQIGPPDPIQMLLAAHDPRNAGNAALIDPMQQYPAGLLGPSPSAPSAPPPPAPYAPKPSIVERVEAKLFPLGNYQGLLDQSHQQQLGRQGLLNVGLNLLQGGGRQFVQHGTLANIGAAIQGVNFPEMAQQALQMQSYRNQQQEQAAIAQVGARHPAVPNETRSDAYNRFSAIITDLLTVPGGAAIAEKYAPVLAALKPDKPGEPQHLTDVVDTRLGSPTIGQSGDFLIPYPGAPRDQWTFVKGKPDAAASATRANAALLTGAESRAAAMRLLAAQTEGQGIESSTPGAAQPSTWAAAVGGMTAKIAGQHAGAGVTQALRGTNTNQYQAAAGRWTDAYMQLLPKSRQGSTALREQIQRTYWGQEGDNQPTVQSKAAARRAATAALARAVASGTPPPLPGFGPEAP